MARFPFSSLVVLSLAASAAHARPAPDALAPPAPAPRQAVPLGGLGTGCVWLRADGSFGELTINNNRGRPLAPPPGAFLAVRARAGEKVVARVLGGENRYGWPAMKEVKLGSGYPVASLTASDPALPVTAQVTAFSPLVPYNTKDSSLPAAIFSVTLTNRSDQPVEAAAALSWENVLGHGGIANAQWSDRRGTTQELRTVDNLSGVVFKTAQAFEDRRKAVVGEYVLLGAAEGGRIAPLPYWNAAAEGDDFWKAFSSDKLFGQPEAPRPGIEGVVHPAGAVAGDATIPPGKSQRYDFVLAWYTPNDMLADGTLAGHYYAAHFADAWGVATYALQYRDSLRAQTQVWGDMIARSSLPAWLRERLLTDAGATATSTLYAKNGYFAEYDAAGRTGRDGRLGLSPLDRRTASQPFLTAIFPTLDRGELALFARLQRENGELPRFSGLAGEHYGRAGFAGAAPSWPDVACGFILQAARYYRATGDQAFLAEVYPSLVRAVLWLRQQDTDGDGVPEGGTTFAANAAGTQAYTAGLFLASLRAVEELASLQRDKDTVKKIQEFYPQARRNVLAELWNGQYFNRFFIPATAARSTDVWWGQLAGEASAASLELGAVSDPGMFSTAVRTLVRAPRITPETGQAGLWCAYFASAGIRAGETDAALAAMSGAAGEDPATSFGALGSWNVLAALSGTQLDPAAGRLTIAPRPPASAMALQVPAIGPHAWMWVDYRRRLSSPNVNLRVKLLRRVEEAALTLQTLSLEAPVGTGPATLGVLVQSPRGIEAGKTEVQDGQVTFTFKSPLEWKVGEELIVDLVSANSNQILVDVQGDRAISLGSPALIDGLRRERDMIQFRLVNPLPGRQVVNLRFTKPNVRDYDLYLNGVRSARLFENEGKDRIAVVTAASPVAESRAARLRKVASRLQENRELAYKEGKLPLIQARIEALQALLDTAMRVDSAARTVEVALVPSGNRPKLNIPADPPDVEKAVAAAEAALRELATLGPKDVPDATARRLLVSAVVPVDADLRVEGELKAKATLSATLTLTNDSDLPVTAGFDPVLPAGWIASRTAPLELGPGKETSVEFSIRLPEEVETRRHRVAVRTTVALPQTRWDLAAASSVGSSFVRGWSIIGPFPNTNDAGLQQPFPPEQEIVADADYNGRRWSLLRTDDDRIDLSDRFSPNMEVIAYAYTRVFSAVEQDAYLELGSGDGVQVRLNGQKVFERHGHREAAPGQDHIKIHLKAGWNALLLKVEQTASDWSFFAELTDLSGGAIEGLRLDPEIAR